jgi:hypothetical protein
MPHEVQSARMWKPIFVISLGGPTYNEREDINTLVERLASTLRGICLMPQSSQPAIK